MAWQDVIAIQQTGQISEGVCACVMLGQLRRLYLTEDTC